MAERSDSAAGNNGKVGRESGDGNEAEIGASSEEFFRTKGGLRVMEAVALGQFGRERWVFKVPHERGRVEEVDGGYADGM